MKMKIEVNITMSSREVSINLDELEDFIQSKIQSKTGASNIESISISYSYREEE